MACDEVLAGRIRHVLEAEPGVTEQRMFGGIAFLVNSHLTVSASGQGGLMLRVDPARTDALLDPPRVRRVEMRGREMDGWLRVDATCIESDDDLRHWVDQGLTYVSSLRPR